jgi:hypothetical protein
MSKSITTTDTVSVNVSGMVDVALNPVHVDPITITPLSIGITQLPVVQIDVKHVATIPIQLAITQLPLIDMRFRMWPTRIHFPVNMKFAVCALGKELLSFEVCGESMIVVEDYAPHRMELCS